ncbi:DNA polymerase III subunit beta [Sulfurovum sp. NBC37-1]|uniref:DNA polymerase III subunit beta n=1 Tax=Sulfurovum sp. (strain NBC37-1) TaxID=387093 RepID=UPI00015876AE|nr:DNA polymerase III subunit beta [Sulfurovum sp. NBC37-1]BAF70963.1 DNA polymerase III, beta subunit [Sulfurovum sp. NBC37-1]
MKIRAQKQIIESILINLQPFLEKKDASQITSHILFSSQNDKCIVKATDSEIGLQIVTDHILIESEGSFTANGKKLLDIIRILKDDEIIMEILDNTLIVKQKHSKFKLPTFDPNAYPAFPSVDEKPQITLDSLSLIQNLKKISPAIDTNNPKFELNGALINIKHDSTDLVGTDTRRLAIASIPGNNSEELSLIVPKKAILEIQKLFLDQINIYYDETNLIITNENYFFYTRLINGKFPDYQRIIPASVKHSITLPKKEMIDSIKMITTISQEIKMTLLSDAIIFNSLSADNVEAKTEIEIGTGLNEKYELSFNSRYILDFISQIDKNEFLLEFNEPSLPFIVKDENFITIIMPIVA